jgi:tetratricopeptide (TPR) repeat protein
MTIKKTRLLLALLAVLSVNGVMAEEVNNAELQRAKLLAANPEQAKTHEEAILLNDMGLKLYEAGHYDQAEPLYQRSLAILEKTLGIDHPDVAASLDNLAGLYQGQAKYQQAEPLYQRSLAIFEKNLGKDHREVAPSLGNLAGLYYAQGKYREAEPLFQRSLAIYEKALGKDHPDVAQILNNLAELYRTQGKYSEAEPLYQRSLAIREKALGKDHPDIAQSLNTLAGLYGNQGKYDQAEPLSKRSLAIREKTLGKDHPDIAQSLNTLAGLYEDQGKYDQAEPLYQRSLAILEKVLGKDHPTVAHSLNVLALLYETQGKYSEAEPLYQRSLAIREKTLGKDHPDVATTLNNLALLYKNQGKYDKAEPLYQRSLAIREKTLGKDHPEFAESLNNLATLYRDQGKYREAKPLYQRCLTINEKVLGKDHPTVAHSLNVLALLYETQGKYSEAEPLYQRSLAIREKTLSKDHPKFAESLNNLAGLYEDQGKYDQAEPLYQRSLAIYEKALGKDHPDVANCLNGLALLYETQGKYSEAEPLYQRSLVIYEKVLGKEHPDVATILGNLAGLYRSQGKYPQAEPLYQRSLAIREHTLGKEHPDVATTLNNLALLYKNQGKYDQAEPLYQRSLAITEKALGKDHPHVAISLDNLALLYLAQNKQAKAKPLFARSLRITNQNLDHWLWGAGEKTRQSYMQQEEDMRNVYLSFYSLANIPEETLYFSLSRKSLLLRIASEANSLAKQSPDPEIQKQQQAFADVRTQIANLMFSGKADKKQIEVLEEQANQLEMQLSQKLTSFKRSNTEVSVKEVLKKLQPDQALIDFLVYTEADFKEKKFKTKQIIALIADSKNGVELIKLGAFAPINKAIKTYRAAIVPNEQNKDSRDQTLKQAAQTLYQQLWQPLTPYLKAKKTVYLIPDGVLHLLPFKALQSPDGQYLADSMQLIQLSSARDLVLPPLEAKAQQSAIFAAPDYGDDSQINTSTTRALDLNNIHFGALASALNEGQQIDKLFRKKQPDTPAKLLMKKDATEPAIRATSAPKVLHLATHGFFLQDNQPDEKALKQSFMQSTEQNLPFIKVDNPLTRSGLAFANANLGIKGIKQNDDTDGILTALEVLNLDLAGTDLVTLSACETGIGDIKIGEGIYSLNRAFQEAGAKAVLSTLWTVDDKTTSDFMKKFYDRFLDGKPAQQAIQETQNEFMKDEKYKNPFYWAGFVMMGKD